MIERLEEHLVTRGLLSQERADDALRSQALVGGAMDTLLLEMGALREQDLVTALGELSGLQPIYLADYVPNPTMASALPREDAERLNLAPLSVEDEMLHVAVAFPVPMRGSRRWSGSWGARWRRGCPPTCGSAPGARKSTAHPSRPGTPLSSEPSGPPSRSGWRRRWPNRPRARWCTSPCRC